MLTPTEAVETMGTYLAGSQKYVHSLAVGEMLALLAPQFNGDPAVWTATGICHDLDYFETRDDWSKHGLVTADWLAGRLPSEALEAIRAHDQRTGVAPIGALAFALILADIFVLQLERSPEAADRGDISGVVEAVLNGRHAERVREHLRSLKTAPEEIAAAAIDGFHAAMKFRPT